MTEMAIMREILVAVTALPDSLFWRSGSGVGRTIDGNFLRANVKGCADLTGCWRGRFVAIEVKTPTGFQSRPQRLFQAAVERAGGIYVIARSPADVLAVLQ